MLLEHQHEVLRACRWLLRPYRRVSITGLQYLQWNGLHVKEKKNSKNGQLASVLAQPYKNVWFIRGLTCTCRFKGCSDELSTWYLPYVRSTGVYSSHGMWYRRYTTLLFHNVPVSQKLSASDELSGEEKTRETAYSTIFYWKQLAMPFFILYQQHNKHQAQMDGSTIVQDQTYSTPNYSRICSNS